MTYGKKAFLTACDRMDAAFEWELRKLTKPIDGRFPRPWMTEMTEPRQAKVFIVGMNQATEFLERKDRGHVRFVDSLFNRNGESCQLMYREVKGAEDETETRQNIRKLTSMLKAEGVGDVLETNVICFPTKGSSRALSYPEYAEGRRRGRQIFSTLMLWIRPQAMIVYGDGAREELEKVLAEKLPKARRKTGKPRRKRLSGMAGLENWRPHVYCIRSLAPPEWRQWYKCADGVMAQVARDTAKRVT